MRASAPGGPDYVGSACAEKIHASTPRAAAWPELPYAAWKDTCDTLHLWTQIVGKVRLSLTPWLNHSWHVTLACHRARACTAADRRWQGRDLHHRVRFHRSCAVAAHQRRPLPPAHAAAHDGRGILRRRAAGAARARYRRAHQRDAERNSRRRAVSRRIAAHAAYDRDFVNRFWRVLLALARRVLAFPHRLSRQGEPGAFLLGQLRPRGDALFRAARRRRIRAACRTCRTRSRARPIRTRCRARASGRAAGRSTIRRSIPTPIRRRRALPRRRCSRTRRSGRRSSANSSCRMTRCAPRASRSAR